MVAGVLVAFPLNVISKGSSFLSLLLKQHQSEIEREHKIKWAFGSVTTDDIWEPFEYRFGIPLYESWSLIEGGITINTGGSKAGKRGSIGKPVSGFEVKIVNLNGLELPPGRENIGQIITKMTIPMKLDYYNPSSLSKDARSLSLDDWIESGDLGYKDEDGYIYFVGREKDMMVKHGHKFNIRNIERILKKHPFILESAAFLVYDENEKEEIKICLVNKNPDLIKHEDIFSYVNENLPYYMIPRYIEFKEVIYKSPAERIRTFTLKNEWHKESVKKNTWDAIKKDYVM